MPADYHIHTPLCMHAQGTPLEFVDAALSKNLEELGISDHAPVSRDFFDDWRMPYTQLPEYLEWIQEAKQHAQNRIPIRSGLECDWLPQCESWIEHLKSYHDWDYLIGSVHYLQDQWDFDNPKWLGKWSEINVDDVWKRYWRSYQDMAASGLFNILAHPDLIKKFGYLPKGDLQRFYDPCIEEIAVSGAVIEINTAGWHKPCVEQYPHIQFLELANQAGIDLIISSDAHSPNEIGRDFQKASEIALSVGYKETVLFDQGERTYIPL